MPPHFGINAFRHLKKQVDFMAKAHQVIVDLLKTPNLADLIEGLRDRARRDAASADPMKAARDAGVIMPASGVSIQFHEYADNWTVEIQVEVDDSLMITGFNSRTGFFTI